MRESGGRKKGERIRLGIWLIILLLLFSFHQSVAWNTGSAKEEKGMLKINGQNAYITPNFFSDLDRPGGALYNSNGHIYILQHAIDLLRQDGHGNWADLAGYNLLHLASGSRHADAYKGRIVIRLAVDAFWGLVELDRWDFDLTCKGGCEHYHDVNTDGGLNLLTWSILANDFVLDQLIKLIHLMSPAGFTLGLVDVDVDVIPDIRAYYPSGLKLSQTHYQNALEAWKGQYLYPSRSGEESAMYELGWACHLIADLSVAQHLHGLFIGGHSDYEDFADGKGDDKDYHASSAQAVYRYASGNTGSDKSQPIGQLGYELVNKLYPDLDHLKKAEDGQDAERAEALKKAIPLAEQYTAAVLAQFLNEVGIPDNTPPLEGYVRESGSGKIIPNAYVFYAAAGPTVQIEQTQPSAASDPKKNWKGWNYIQADGQGHYSLPVKKFTKYLIRPAMPGYSFKGKTGASLEFGQQVVPVLYSPPNVSYSTDFLEFSMDLLPATSSSIRVVAPSQTSTAVTLPLAKPIVFQALRPALISDKIKLANSGSEISSTLAETIYRGVLSSQCSANVLGTAGGNASLPEEAIVTLQVSNLVSYSQAKLLSSIFEVIQAVDETRTKIKMAQLPKTLINNTIPPVNVPADLKPMDKDRYLALKALLPIKTDTTSTGKSIKVVSPSAFFEGNEGASLLLENGLLLTPAKSGVEIEVRADSESGLLKADSSPLKLVTGNGGTAVFRVKSGSHAGKIRLRYNVLKNPQAVEIHPEGIIEILVKPGLDPDPSTETPAKLEQRTAPIMVVAGYVAGGDQITLKSYHSILEVGPQGIKEKGKTYGPVARPIDIVQPSAGAPKPAPSASQVSQGVEIAITGQWNSNIGAVYEIQQSGNEFTWSAPSLSQSGTGTISGKSITLSGPGWTVKGQVTETDASGNPTKIVGENGVILFRTTGGTLVPAMPAAQQPGPSAPTAPTGGVMSLSGQWNSNIGAVYQIQQSGNELAWSAPSLNQSGTGTISGKSITLSGPGWTVKGQVTETDASGNPTKIVGENGVVLMRAAGAAPGTPTAPSVISLAGQWKSSIGRVYDITQQGGQIAWTVVNSDEKGQGTITGSDVSASWKGLLGSGSSSGKITVDSSGKATEIKWSNGVSFYR